MRKKYVDEFNRNAVEKVIDGQSVRSVSQELGVNKWKRAALEIAMAGDENFHGWKLRVAEKGNKPPCL